MPIAERFLSILAIALAITLAGLLSRQGPIIAAALPLFLYCAALLASNAGLPTVRLTADRELESATIPEDEEQGATLILTNHGPTLHTISAEDDIPAEAHVCGGEPTFLGPLEAGDTLRLAYRIRANRGRHTQGSTQVVLWPRFGLAYSRISVPVATSFSALPFVESLGSIAIHPRRILSFTGPVLARRGGAGINLFGCRVYQPGDDIRRINWRASARREDWVINDYEQERMTDVNLILDVRAAVHTRTGSIDTFDLCVRAAASLASHFVRQGNRVGLLTYGDYLNWIFPSAGRLQLERILLSLARARPSNRIAFGELRRIPTRLFAPGSQLIIISPLGAADDHEVPALLVARGYSVLVVHPDSLALEESNAPNSEVTHLAARIARLEQRVALRRLAHAGVDIVNWDITQSLESAFRYRPDSGRKRAR